MPATVDAAKLYAEHHPALFRYLVRLTGDADVAADAVQETFAKLLEKPPRDEQPKAWLFTVATNVVRKWANRTKRRVELIASNADRAGIGDAPPDPESKAESRERKRVVRQALARLQERERTVLLMREEGFSHREIAEAVGTTTGSVGTMIARAFDKLASELPLDAEEMIS